MTADVGVSIFPRSGKPNTNKKHFFSCVICSSEEPNRYYELKARFFTAKSPFKTRHNLRWFWLKHVKKVTIDVLCKEFANVVASKIATEPFEAKHMTTIARDKSIYERHVVLLKLDPVDMEWLQLEELLRPLPAPDAEGASKFEAARCAIFGLSVLRLNEKQQKVA